MGGIQGDVGVMMSSIGNRQGAGGIGWRTTGLRAGDGNACDSLSVAANQR